MGIKRKVSATYLSDRGQEFELSEMASSHLINVIAHHQKQLDALSDLPTALKTPFLEARMDGLQDTIRSLALELGMRNPDEDHKPSQGWRDEPWRDHE